VIKLLGGNVVRWMMLSAHYRAPINITDEVIETARVEVNKALAVLKQVEIKSQLANYDLTTELTSNHFTLFLDAMQDDLNTPNAMKSIFDVIKSVNALIRSKELKDELRVHYHDLMKMLDVFGIKHEVTVLNDHQLELYKQWNQAKENKDFVLADTFRQELINENVLV
jgi:cysteinyl-tRNA synthetase